MAGKSIALYRKYRGVSFEDIIGQEHITNVLSDAVAKKRISHAYLFTGPRGVGKTSIARILAHLINGFDYVQEENHIDIIEIDAASNRRIDEIRDLREKAHVAPVHAKFKVYIIDEVHMLTKEAFNALLKTLEEPPAHVVFILATTEAHKLPATIISRTQRFTFRPIPIDVAAGHLRTIADKENIKIDDDALRLIAEHGDGSFRDSISLLDQMSGNDKKISVDAVRELLGMSPIDSIEAIIDCLKVGNREQLLEVLTKVEEQGIQPAVLSSQIIEFIRTRNDYVDYIELVEQLLDVPAHQQPKLKLEIILLSACNGNESREATPATQNESPPLKPLQQPEHPVESTVEEEPVAPTIKSDISSNDEENEDEAHSGPAPKNARPPKTEDWDSIVKLVKEQNNAIATILRTAPPLIQDGEYIVTVRFEFHKKKLADKAVVKMIEGAMTEVLGGPVPFAVRVNANLSSATVAEKKPADDSDELADSIIATFGGGERIEI